MDTDTETNENTETDLLTAWICLLTIFIAGCVVHRALVQILAQPFPGMPSIISSWNFQTGKLHQSLVFRRFSFLVSLNASVCFKSRMRLIFLVSNF